MKEKIDTVIIGGGHAGLTMSSDLSQAGRELWSSNGAKWIYRANRRN
jgi:thioredoxin reductase